MELKSRSGRLYGQDCTKCITHVVAGEITELSELVLRRESIRSHFALVDLAGIQFVRPGLILLLN